MENNLAVAMSVYKNDSHINVKKCLDSLLNQTYKNIDIYIEVDGPIDRDLESLLVTYSEWDNIYINYGDNNCGLAYRLNKIIDLCVSKKKYQFLARMDADDICREDRFEKQLAFLLAKSDVDVVGSSVMEIDEEDRDIFYKKMPTLHDQLVENIIKRCPFNHPTVMFRMSVFNEGFRYNPNLKNTQDYYLWVDLISSGKILANIDEPLLKFRVDNNFHSRRGLDKALNDLKSRMYAFKKLNVLSLGNVSHTILLFLLRLSPASIKKLAYSKLR